MLEINREELAKVHYIQHIPSDGRSVVLNSYYDDNSREWFMYLDHNGKIIRMGGGEMIRGSYWCNTPVTPERDLELPLATLINQQLSFPKVVGSFRGIQDDIHQFAAIMEIYHVISSAKHIRQIDTAYLMASEMEHLIITIRSLYDLLQKLSKRAAALVVTGDESKRRVIAELPDSFADVVLNGANPRSEEELITKFRLPKQLANFYATRAKRFAMLRDIRVSIEHHGKTLPTPFALEEGMAIGIDEKPWSELPLWKAEFIRNGRLGPVRAVYAYLISDVPTVTEYH